jgi:predicted GIY-YIG superfamily endonuclease
MNIHQYLRIVKFSYINWKDTDIVYGIYKNNKLLYIGKSSTFEVRKAKHLRGKYKDCDICNKNNYTIIDGIGVVNYI